MQSMMESESFVVDELNPAQLPYVVVSMTGVEKSAHRTREEADAIADQLNSSHFGVQSMLNVSDSVTTGRYLGPTPEMLSDPVFEAIWNAIKGWDISPENNGLYSGPTGNDARYIYDAVKRVQQ